MIPIVSREGAVELFFIWSPFKKNGNVKPYPEVFTQGAHQNKIVTINKSML